MLKVFTFPSNKVTIEIFTGQSFMYSPFCEHKIGNNEKVASVSLKERFEIFKDGVNDLRQAPR